MTDATLSVTQSRLAAFARQYLNTLGASIREEESRWHVGLPTHVDVEFGDGREFDIALGSGSSGDDSEDDFVLAPGSEFVQQLLDEAISMSPVGRVSVTDALTGDEYRYPEWISGSDLRVADESFTPYYDRDAVFVLVEISVETVSEYQTSFLEAVAIDIQSGNELPGLPGELLNAFYDPKNPPTDTGPEDSAAENEVGDGAFKSAVTEGQRTALDNVGEGIAEIRETASRAADSEFDEYRQLQNQQLSDFQDEIVSIRNRIERVAGDVDNAGSHEERVTALQTREELQAEKEELEQKRAELLQEKQRGFEEKRREIFGRHELEISTKPLVSTVVSYERGEIEFQFADSRQQEPLRAPYAVGGGCVDTVSCGQCQTALSAENPVEIGSNGLECRSCR